MKRITWIVIIVVGLLALAYIGIEWVFSQPCDPPSKPDNVPASAIWKGGCDGGSWIDIKKTEAANNFYIDVYNEYNGELNVGGIFELEENCSGQQYDIEKLRNSITAFDGEKIILSEKADGHYCTLLIQSQ